MNHWLMRMEQIDHVIAARGAGGDGRNTEIHGTAAQLPWPGLPSTSNPAPSSPKACCTASSAPPRMNGAIGKGFIEAHHLKPISTLEEGVAVTYDVAADFAVLCANCHRMIHRSDDPSNLSLFKKNLAAIKS
jgi:hypothetical protein